MNLELVENIANAVLYEGYMLYPYRASSVKNRQRFNWGALAPESYSAAQNGTEAFEMQTECLLEGDEDTTFDVKIRFLHLILREIGELENPLDELPKDAEPNFHFVQTLDVNGQLYQTWQEAIEREVNLPTFNLSELSKLFSSCDLVAESDKFNSVGCNPTTLTDTQTVPERDEQTRISSTLTASERASTAKVGLHPPLLNLSASRTSSGLNTVSKIQQFSFPTTRTLEPLPNENNTVVGVIVRTQQEIFGAIELRVEEVKNQKLENSEKRVYKLSVKIKNQTSFENAGEQSRDDALLHSLVSTHTILSAKNGEFISLLEPPDALEEAVASCENIKTYPVLAGTEGDKDCVLSSPIILYDYPQIAAESAGDLFDGAEIDEILTLRIMTLTDDEKREMRGLDDRARKMLERTENMPDEQLLKMHGAMKGVAKSKSQGNE